MNEVVLYEKEGGIGRITLNNPDSSNPFDLKVLQKLIEAFRKSSDNGDVCVRYEAKGKNFTFGADLKYAYEMITRPELRSEAAEYLWSWQEVTSAMLEHPGIIIVGYHGWIVGGGFEHTLACDLRIAADNTRIMLPELGMGIFFSNASTKLLPRIIGEGRAKQLMLLGEVVRADEALAMGLVNHVCPAEELDAVMQDYATKIALKDPLALRLAKRVINEAQERSIDEVLYREGRAMIETGQSDGTRQRIQAFVEGEK